MAEPPLYVACLKLPAQPALVVGGGPIAAGKTESLVACGADVTVVAPTVTDAIRRLVDTGRIRHEARTYKTSDLDDTLLVVAATDDEALHRRIHEEATAARILVNVVDVPELCTFIVPALHRDGPITVAISTAGASPALAKRMRDELAATFGPSWGALAARLQQERGWAREMLPTYQARQVFFESIVLGDPDPIALIESGDAAALDALIDQRKQDQRKQAT